MNMEINDMRVGVRPYAPTSGVGRVGGNYGNWEKNNINHLYDHGIKCSCVGGRPAPQLWLRGLAKRSEIPHERNP
jgi:hypothetical protein